MKTTKTENRHSSNGSDLKDMLRAVPIMVVLSVAAVPMYNSMEKSVQTQRAKAESFIQSGNMKAAGEVVDSMISEYPDVAARLAIEMKETADSPRIKLAVSLLEAHELHDEAVEILREAKAAVPATQPK